MKVSVDAIIENRKGEIALIYRRDFPKGWAFPGGHMEESETLKKACIREAREETGLKIKIIGIGPTGELGIYDDPKRDPRKRMVGAVYVAKSISGELKGASDAKEARWFSTRKALKLTLCFDHKRILKDYLRWKRSGRQFI